MSAPQPTLPCPSCGTLIPFAHALIEGAQVVCPGCGAQVGIEEESRSEVQKAMDGFDALRRAAAEGPPRA